MYPTLSISDKNVKKYFLLPDYIHNFSGSIYINIRRHSKLSFFSFNYDDSFWQKKSFANTLSSIFHCPPSILLKLSTIFLGDLTWRRRWWWFDPSVTFLYEKTCRCAAPMGLHPFQVLLFHSIGGGNIMTFCLEKDFFFSRNTNGL